MLRTLDRYVIREILPPFLLALLVFTFILQMQPVARIAQPLLAKGAPVSVVARALVMLLPQALAVTIPMAFLLGLLVAFGRLSGDSEWVAIQACGVSLVRMLRPVLVLAVFAWGLTQWVMVVAVPWCNQAFREIEYNLVATRVETEIKPRVFFQDFKDLVLYARDVRQGVPGWSDVFVADTSRAGSPVVYLARHGRMVTDRSKRTVELVLEDGVEHKVTADEAGREKYESTRFASLVMNQDPGSVFPDAGPQKGEPEMTVAELRERAEQLRRQGGSPHNAIWYIQQKFSIPVACLVFAFIGLGFGISSTRGGKLAAFTVGIGVIFAYYVLLFTSHAAVKGARLPAEIGPWVPNVVLGLFGLAVVAGRNRFGGSGFRVAVPAWLTRRKQPGGEDAVEAALLPRPKPKRVVVVIRLPRLGLARPLILDRYVARIYCRIVGLCFVALLGIFYIANFIDRSDKLFKGKTTLGVILQWFWFETPQFVYYIIPMSGLLAALVTIGILTRTSELIVMRACGISLYRVAAPLLVFGALASVVLFGLQDYVLAESNRQADQLDHLIRSGSMRVFDVLNHRWVVGRDGAIYNYEYFEPRRKELTRLSIYEFDEQSWNLTRRTFISSAIYDKTVPAGRKSGSWVTRQGWMRELDANGEVRSFVPVNGRRMALEEPDYFGTEQPEAERMTYRDLKRYIDEMRAAGFNVVPFLVALYQKVSFPFVSIIMTLLAVPFAVTTGRRGALYGIGVGIVLAMVYWTANNLFGAIGEAGILSPMLAAWAPNILFGAGAAYLLLTVRT